MQRRNWTNISKPYRSYTAEIINLVEAVQDEEKKEQYKEVFSIALGDTVLLISKSTGIRESHRIVKFYEYPVDRKKRTRSNWRTQGCHSRRFREPSQELS